MQDHDNKARAYLASLDDPPLPEGLWQRVEAARGRRMRVRGAAVASVAVCALAAGLLLQDPDGAPEEVAAGSAAAVVQPADAAADDIGLTVRAIDRALQAAYDRNASDDEIEPLWEARRELVRVAPAASRKEG